MITDDHLPRPKARPSAGPQTDFNAWLDDTLRRLPVALSPPPFVCHVPVYDLKAAAGAFSEGHVPEESGWMEITGRRLEEGMFVAQVVGDSMNRRIPNGAYCLFRRPVTGMRQGRVLLVQHQDIADPELGGHYTVKLYESEKGPSEDGGWRHGVILLKPDSTEPRFELIVLRDVDEDAVDVIAEVLQVVEG